jgi:hypothetical protein
VLIGGLWLVEGLIHGAEFVESHCGGCVHG